MSHHKILMTRLASLPVMELDAVMAGYFWHSGSLFPHH
jgi:hypothetical protein